MMVRAGAEINGHDLKAYRDGWEHISDEFKLLDLRIRRQLHLQQALYREANPNQFRGLFISAQEAEELLSHVVAEQSADPVLNSLNDAIKRMLSYLGLRIDESLGNGVFLPLEYLVRVFDLNYFERNCLLLCLAMESDRKYEKLFAFLQDDINCKYPMVDLAIKLFCQTPSEKGNARLSLAMNAPLMKYFLRSEKGNTGQEASLSYPLKLNRRLLNYFHQPLEIDPGIQEYAEFFSPYWELEPLLLDGDVQERLRAWWGHAVADMPNIRKPLGILCGPPGSGKSFQIQHLCSHVRSLLLIIDLSKMAVDEESFQKNLEDIIRECLLIKAVPCLKGLEGIIAGGSAYEDPAAGGTAVSGRWKMLLKALQELPAPLFILSSTAFDYADLISSYSILKIELGVPDELSRQQLWETFGGFYDFAQQPDWGQMAGKFRFTPGQIKKVLVQARESGYGNRDNDGRITFQDLYAACFAQGRHYLGRTAARINPAYSWEDLILPPEPLELLGNACDQMKNRYVVYGQWGFGKKLPYGRGLSMLFSGLPGTGKTMAAQVIASELKLELYRIDLAQVVSKYIGETEKNLRQIFREAEYSNAILFFDEADALFGKRSEVKDSHDRYANIEIAYLLQKVEEYEGISILATNLSKNMDEAFVRRITFIVEFPFPDEEFRKKIWKSMFPQQAPVDKEVDFDFLASRFEIAGGNIKYIVLSAAFLAAQAREAVSMHHILRATKYEYQKIGRVLLREDLGEYYDELSS